MVELFTFAAFHSVPMARSRPARLRPRVASPDPKVLCSHPAGFGVDQLVANFEAFSEAGVTSFLDGGYVNEHVRAAVIRYDEAKAFLHVKKFDCSQRHVCPHSD